MPHRRPALILLAACLAAVPFLPGLQTGDPSSEADTTAKAFLVIWGDGEEVVRIKDLPGDFPAEMRKSLAKELGSDRLAIGYYYKYVHIFWLNIWTWGGEFVLYAGDHLMKIDVPEFRRALGIDKLAVPSAYSYPTGLLVYGGIILAEAQAKKEHGPREKEEMMPGPDPEDRMGKIQEEAYEKAIQRLVGYGIPQDRARRDFLVIQSETPIGIRRPPA